MKKILHRIYEFFFDNWKEEYLREVNTEGFNILMHRFKYSYKLYKLTDKFNGNVKYKRCYDDGRVTYSASEYWDR